MMLAVGEVPRIGRHTFQAGQFAFAGVRGAGGEGGLAGLVPEGDAGIVILALVPARGLAVRVFIRRNPAEVLEGDFDARVEDEGVVEVPAIGAGVAADDSPLVEIGHAEIG